MGWSSRDVPDRTDYLDDSLYMKSETVVLDRAYERDLARMNLQVEYGVDDTDTVLAVPVAVVRNVTTIPLPKSMLASLP